jgi:hypothetical protein
MMFSCLDVYKLIVDNFISFPDCPHACPLELYNSSYEFYKLLRSTCQCTKLLALAICVLSMIFVVLSGYLEMFKHINTREEIYTYS